MEDNTLLAEKETVVEKEKAVPKKLKRSDKQSSVMDKPNYDLIEELTPEEREALKDEEEITPEESPEARKQKRFRVKIAAIAMATIGVLSAGWVTYNIITIANVSSQVATVTADYSINMTKYLIKISALDGANKGNELIETYPEELQDKTETSIKSNWFDKLCNLISRIFGG